MEGKRATRFACIASNDEKNNRYVSLDHEDGCRYTLLASYKQRGTYSIPEQEVQTNEPIVMLT